MQGLKLIHVSKRGPWLFGRPMLIYRHQGDIDSYKSQLYVILNEYILDP